MRKSSLILLGALASLTYPAAVSGAGPDAPTTAAAPAASTQLSDPPSGFATTISYIVQSDGSYRLREVFNLPAHSTSMARQLAEQSFGWSSGLEKLTLGRAYTLKSSGAIIPVGLDAVLSQAVSTDTDFPSFSDWQIRTIVFPDLRNGDTAHYELDRVSIAPLFPGQFEASVHFPGGSAELVLDAPAAMTLQIATPGMVEAAAEQRADGRLIRRWHLTRDDAGEASWAASTFKDYAALGRAYAERANPKAAPGLAVRVLAARLTQGITDRRAQAQALYDYVSGQIRYVGLQLGSGRIVPRSTDAILATGYGDCKDHAVLLQALLSSIGIPAEAALISSRARYDLPQPATLDVLDHVILYLPEIAVWLDPTSGFAPFGILPIGEYGKPVVLVGMAGDSGTTARMGQVPALGAGYAWSHTETDLAMADDGTFSGETETTAGGPYAVALREIADGLGNAGDQLRHLGTPGTGGFDYDTPRALNSHDYRVDGRFTLEDGMEDQADHRIVPPVGLTVMVRPGGFLVSETSLPGQTDIGARLCYNGVQEEEIRLHLPASRQAGELPADISISRGFATYTAQWRIDGPDLVVDRRFILNAPHPVCSGSDYQTLRPVLRAARLGLRRRLLIQDRPQAIAAAPMPAHIQPASVELMTRPAP